MANLKIVEKAQEWLRSRALRPLTVQRNKAFHSLSDAKHIGIVVNLCEEYSEEAYRMLLNVFRKMNINCAELFISIEKNAPNSSWCIAIPHSTVVTRTDINKLGVPSLEIIKDFCDNTYDILINLSTQYNFTADCVMVHTCAEMTVGTRVSEQVRYDLEISDAPQGVEDEEDEDVYYEDEDDQIDAPELPKFTAIDLAQEIIRYLTTIKAE